MPNIILMYVDGTWLTRHANLRFAYLDLKTPRAAELFHLSSPIGIRQTHMYNPGNKETYLEYQYHM